MSIKSVGFFALLAVIASFVTVVSADDKLHVGGIKGVVDYCGSGPKDRVRIYIPGRQFSLTTGSDGKFMFEFLPVGTYDLGFELNNQFIGDKKVVDVRAGELTDVGAVTVCPEMDGKSDESQNKELKIDKEKLGVCRDDYQGVIMVANGRAQCQNGKISQLSCNNGFADCDKDIASGCEINLMQDDENCGRCGNACSSLELCTLGSC